jgi:aspartate/methionine/tyrosine aminotransferase
MLTHSLPDFRLEVYLGKWEFSARHHLTASDPQTLTIQELLALGSDADRDAFTQLPLGYTPTWGTARLLRAIASTYETLESEHALTFAGAEEAMFWVLQELVGPGDHAIITVPNYQSMESVVLAAGAEASGIALNIDEGGFDLRELVRLIRPNTRLVAVNFPNNPTGIVPPAQQFRELVSICDSRGITLFSDEVYRGIELDPQQTLPQASDLSASAVSLNVMSKAYGLPGLRIGWLASRNRSLLERLERRKHYTTICNAAPSEFLACMALENAASVQARIRSIIAANIPRFRTFFERWSDLFEWRPPAGGCVSYARYRGADGVERFCQRLLEEAGVVLLPASIFRSALVEMPTDRFRIGIGRLDPEPALAAFDGYLRRASI